MPRNYTNPEGLHVEFADPEQAANRELPEQRAIMVARHLRPHRLFPNHDKA